MRAYHAFIQAGVVSCPFRINPIRHVKKRISGYLWTD
jgi:hypothetical protein